MVLDSVSELKILSETNARYRREILGLKQFFAQQNCSVLVLDDRTTREGEQQLQSIAHGVIHQRTCLPNAIVAGNPAKVLRYIQPNVERADVHP